MRASGLLNVGGLSRTEESEKTSTVATTFVAAFAGDFSSQQASSEWRLRAAKGVASAVKGTKRVNGETPVGNTADSSCIELDNRRSSQTESNRPPTGLRESVTLTENSLAFLTRYQRRMMTSIEDEEPADYYPGPARPFYETTNMIAYRSPNSSVYQVYDPLLLQINESPKPIAQWDVEDIPLIGWCSG